jgi:RNA polymerase sigma-70 factor (ECF subfamily)
VQEELVHSARQGDAEAFDTLARMVGDRCLAIAVRILRDVDLAEDAVQAALITAWTDLRALRDSSRFEPWLHRILTRACFAEARRRKRWSEGPRILPVAAAYGPDDYLTVDDRDLLERAMRRLTVQHRAVLVFHYYLGLSISEVAARTDLPSGLRSPACITPCGRSGPASRLTPGRPRLPRSDWHDRLPRSRPHDSRLSPRRGGGAA